MRSRLQNQEVKATKLFQKGNKYINYNEALR